LIPLGAGAWMALLAGGLLAPAAAKAGCVHYVVANGRAEAERLSVNDLEIFSASRLRGNDSPIRAPADRPVPCSGMSCSRNPVAPLVPTAPLGSLRAEFWACVAVSPPPFAPPSLAACAAHSAARPVRLAFPPERPPRAF